MTALQGYTGNATSDIAPNHKMGLQLESPLLAASGCWGFANEYSDLVETRLLGALITNPIKWNPSKNVSGQYAQAVPGGIALQDGLPNPGLHGAIRRFGNKWRHMDFPIILHITVNDKYQARKCVDLLEELENVIAIELSFRHDEDPRAAAATVATAAQGLLPVVVQTPFSRTLEFTALAEDAGAQAVTVSSPPRATLKSGNSWFDGSLYGSGWFTHALHNVYKLRQETTLPIIATGDIHSVTQIKAMLSVGAQAVQLQSLVWIDPQKVNTMLRLWKA